MHPLVKNSEQNGLLNYIRILLSISIVLSIFNPVIIASAASADAVSIGSDRVDPGDVANVAILINNSNNVSGMNLTLEYDPGTIELANIFENYSSTTGHVVSYIDNSGTVDIEVRQIDNLTDAGSVPVLDLVFNALSSGTSDLGLLNVELIENGVPSSPDVTTVGSITVNTAPEFGIIADQYVNESELLSFKLNATDIDNDDLTFDKDVIFGNIAGDVFSWTPTSSDIGVHYINFSVTDSELQDYTVVTITVNEASSVTYTPASPVNFINTTGNFWVLHEWEAGIGDVADSYNVSYDSSWYNSTDLEFNDTVGMNAHDWSNITVYAYNATSSTLSSGIESKVQIPNNPMTITDIDPSVSVTVGSQVSVDAGFIDADPTDVATFDCNRSDLFSDFNTNDGTGSWTPTTAGTYYVEFNVTDGYGIPDSATMEIIVNDIIPSIYTPAIPVNLINTTGNFWVLHEWEAGNSGNITDGYNVSYDNSWYNTTGLEFNDTVGMNAHDWSNITVYAYNATSSTLSSGVESKVQIPNNPISIIDVPSIFIVNEGDTITIDANRTDADGDSPTFSSDDLDIFDIDPSSGVASWLTKHKDIGTHYVNLTVSDGYGSVDHQLVTITVTNVNSAPELQTIGSQSVFEGQELAFTLNGTDPDNDPLTYSMSGEPAGATLDPSTGDFSWTPDYDDEGIHSIEFMVSDDSNVNDTENVLITVNNMNRAPVLDAIGPQSVNESETLTFTLNATDLDNETLTYSMSGSLSGATLDPSTGVFSWTPGYDASGIHYVDFIVTDPVNGEDLENVTITVNNVNRAPEIASIGAQSVAEGQELSFTLVGSDDDTDDTLTYSMSGSLSGATLNETTGDFSWIPDYDTTNATAGFDDVTAMFTVSDGEDTASQYVIITVTNTNRAPEFPAFGTVNAYEGTELVLNISATDPDEDTLSYFTNATFGTMNGTNFEWTPDYTQAGTYSVEFIVEDASLDDKTVVTIVVNDVNRAPVLDYIPTVSVNETEEVSITLSATDPDGDSPLSYSMDSSLGDLSDNVFTWTPDFIHQGTHYINFTVSDGSLSDTQMAVIGVNDTNAAPVFESVGQQNISEGEPLSFTVTATDVDDEPLSYSVSGDPSTATISYSSTGITFSWTPSYDEAGTYNVEFIVKDGLLYSDNMIVPIVVSNVNRAPVFDSLQSGYTINESEYLAITLGANDPDSEDEDLITVWINNTGNASGTLNGDIYSWNTDYRDSGVYNMEFIVSDGTVNTSGTTTITINDVNAPPVLSSIGSKSVEEGDKLTFTITASDVDGDNLTYSALDLPDNATLGNTTGVFTWIPLEGEANDYPITFSVTDGVDTDSQKVTITVTATSSSSSTTSSSSGGGGGGGGAATSGEEFDNIDFKDYNLKSVVREVDTSFSFYKGNNSIVSLSFISELNAGQVKAVVEILKDTSSQVDSAAPGDVYKNMNIYIDSNLADDVIDDCKINFKVDKVWVDENNIDVSMITLCRYNSGEWDILPTEVTGEDEYYYYFTSTTPGFSSYAISSVDPSTMTQEVSAEEIVATSVDIEPMMSTEDETPLESGAELPQKESSSFPFLIVIGLIGIMAMGFVGYRNRDYYEKVKTQLGNPDGKRYRRMKK